MDQVRATLLTPPARGAIAVIRIRGEHAIESLSGFFRPVSGHSCDQIPIGQIAFGRWQEGSTSEEVVFSRRSENEIEVHCHGGQASSKAILDSLKKVGCLCVDWQEEARDSIEEMALSLLPLAPTERTAAILLDQLRGALRRELTLLSTALESKDTTAAEEIIDRLLSFAPVGKRLIRPWKIVIAGPPNVGKSTLINAMLGYERAIVFDQPGTTRDVVSATTALDGWPIELFDTAGIRDEADALETVGIEIAKRQLTEADFVVWLRDTTRPQLKGPMDVIPKSVVDHSLTVWNKVDLANSEPGDDTISISALNGEGLDQLFKIVVSRLVGEQPQPGQAVPFCDDQIEALCDIRRLLDSAQWDLAKTRIADIITCP